MFIFLVLSKSRIWANGHEQTKQELSSTCDGTFAPSSESP